MNANLLKREIHVEESEFVEDEEKDLVVHLRTHL